MIRPAFCLFTLLLTLVVVRAAEDRPKPAVQIETLESPARVYTAGVSLASAHDGLVGMAWADRTDDEIALRFSTFDPVGKKWRAPSPIIEDGRNFHLMEWPGVFPAVSLGVNGLGTVAGIFGFAAHNLETGVWFRQTVDGGKTWGKAAWLSQDTTLDIENVALTTLADGRVLVAWFDGRDYRKRVENVMQLMARVIGEPGPEILVDPSVARFSQLALTPFPDGGALLAYNGHTGEHLLTVRTARFHGHKWDPSKPLDNDIARATGPRLASDGGRVAATWFSAANNDSRVLVSFSPDAGAHFLTPLRLDHGKPSGGADALMLHDGTLLVTWLESDGSVWLRRVTPQFAADEPVQLSPAGAAKGTTVPRVALLHDYAGDKTSAQFVVAFTGNGADPLRSLLVTIPEGELLAATQECDCAPTPAQLAGFPLRGAIASIAAERAAVRVQHEEIPGLLAEGAHEFRATPEVLAELTVGTQILGRIEQRDGAWWIFDVQLLALPATAK